MPLTTLMRARAAWALMESVTAVALGNEAGTAVAAGFVQLVVTQAVTTTAATSTTR